MGKTIPRSMYAEGTAAGLLPIDDRVACSYSWQCTPKRIIDPLK
jgi:hypothetical protein